MFVKHVCPLSLNVTVTLTFDLVTQNSRGSSSTYHDQPDTKLEDSWAISSLVIGRTRFVYGPTYRHVQSNIPPLLRRRA